jgi:hypothetical protein
VIAHTRTLNPNDEVLRVLEAMGILALLTRETPAEIAAERKSLQKILENALSKADEIEKRMAGYTLRLESRIGQLPKEMQEGLDPPRMAKLLGEACGNVSSNPVCRRPPECLASLVHESK